MPRNKKTFQPKSLYDIAKKRVRVVFKDDWQHTKVLPKRIQRELLLDWMRCDETIPESDEYITKTLEAMENGWEYLKPISTETFLHLMRLPNEVPPFAYERNHVIWDYYEWHQGLHLEKLCNCCMVFESKFFEQYSANFWLENNWQFKRIQDHDVYSGEILLENLIWNRDNWCSRCITEPLWENILDDEDCLYQYNYHLRKKRQYDDSSSEDESDIDYRRVSNVVGNRMSPSMYSVYKKNKWLD